MKMFTTLRTLVLVACCMFGLTASAQFTATVDQYSRTDYAPEYAQFTLSEVATAVGTDAATLAAAFDTWLADGSEDTQLFGIPDGDSTNTGYNADGRGSYWLNLDGSLGGWGENAVYNGIVEYNVDDNYFVIPLGHYPNTVGTANLNFVLQYNGQKATFAVTYNIKAIPSVDAAPEFYTDLTVVGNATCESEQVPNSSYAKKAVSVNIPDMAEKLGLDNATLSAAIATMVNLRQYDTESGILLDTLRVLQNFSDGWTHETVYVDGEQVGEPSGIVGAATYGDGDAMFLQAWAYDAESGNLSFNVGQFPGTLSEGKNWTANLYICNGAKAYQVDYTLKYVAPSYDSIEDMEQVGETTVVEVEQIPTTNYESVSFHLDMDAIAEELGCEVSGISLRAFADESNLATESTANNGGWWFSAEGYVHSYSGATFYIEPAEANNYTTLGIGQMPNTCQIGDEYTADLICLDAEAGKYHRVTVKYIIKEKEDDQQDLFESVATRNITLQQLLDTEYVWSAGVTIPNAQIYELLGITSDDVTLYALDTDESAAETGKAYTDQYTCTPYPGFWLTQDGRRVLWGNDSYWGISAGLETSNDGVTFNAIQFPGNTNIGDSFTGKFFLVNLETKKMITVNVTYQIVETLDEVEEVGNINLNVPVGTSDNVIDFDKLPAIAEAIGVEDLLEGYYLRGVQANGQWCEAVSATNGLTFTAEGYVAEMEGIGIFFEEGKVGTYSNNAIEDDWKAEATIGFQNDNKRYVINLVLMSEKLYADGIADIQATDNAAQNIYTISGVKVQAPTHGIYIVNGKKIVK